MSGSAGGLRQGNIDTLPEGGNDAVISGLSYE